jgi:hypothetical protein
MARAAEVVGAMLIGDEVKKIWLFQ